MRTDPFHHAPRGRSGSKRAARTARRLGGTLLLAVGLLTGPVRAGEGIRFEYRFQPESTYDQSLETNLSISMEMAGLPEDQAGMANAMMQGMTQEMTMKMVLEMGALEGDGSMPMELRLESMQAAMVIAGQRMETPATIAPGTRMMAGRITPGGRMTGVEMEGADAVSSETVDRLLQFIPELPTQEMAIGDSFEVPMKVAVPLPSANMEMAGKAVYTLRSVEGDEATFDVVQAFSMGMEGGPGAQLAGMTMDMDGGGTGTAVFDRKEGIFTRMRTEMEINATVEGTPPEAADTGEGGEPAGPFNMKIKVGGPVEMTILRRVAP